MKWHEDNISLYTTCIHRKKVMNSNWWTFEKILPFTMDTWFHLATWFSYIQFVFILITLSLCRATDDIQHYFGAHFCAISVHLSNGNYILFSPSAKRRLILSFYSMEVGNHRIINTYNTFNAFTFTCFCAKKKENLTKMIFWCLRWREARKMLLRNEDLT